jgi:hypothetical protein
VWSARKVCSPLMHALNKSNNKLKYQLFFIEDL